MATAEVGRSGYPALGHGVGVCGSPEGSAVVDATLERLPIAEAARRLRLSPKTLRRHAQQGTIPVDLRPEKTPVGWYLTLPQGYAWPLAQPGSARGSPESAGDGRPVVGQESEPGLARGTPAVEAAVKAAVAATVETWRPLLDQALDRASQAEQAAAMWQERARNLEAELQHVLALPAHQELESPRRWWQWWRAGSNR